MSTSPIAGDDYILSTVLTSSYLVGFSPFKLQILKDGSVNIISNRFHKVICVCIVIGSNLVRIAEVRSRVPGSILDWTPLFYFQLFCGLINVIFNLTVAKALFYEPEAFLNVVRFSVNCNSLPRSQQNFQSAIKWTCFGEACLGIIVSFMDIFPSFNFSSQYFSQFIACTSREAKYTVFLESDIACNVEHESQISHIRQLAISDYFIALLFSIVKTFRHIHGYYGELLLLAGVLTLWLPAKSFYRTVRDEQYSPMNNNVPLVTKFESLHAKYTSFKQLSKLVNESFGVMFLWLIVASVFYFSCNLDGLVITNSSLVRIRVVSFYISAFITFLAAADITQKVKAFDDWISDLSTQDINMIPPNSLSIIIHELSSHKIGMSGNNIFTVTYTFLANMAGVLLTYFIVCVQFRAPWTDWDKMA